MIAIANKGETVPRPAASVFATALKQERARFQYSRHEVADQCGVSVGKIDEWERGESVPDPQRFKRLVGMMRRLAATPPQWGDGSRSTLADKTALDIQKEVARIKEPERVPEPEEFHIGLKRIREANGISRSAFAELLGLVSGAVGNWEANACGPSGDNIERIYELLPELKTAVDVGAVKAPVIARKTRGRTPKHLAEPAQPTLTLVKTEPEPVPVNDSVKPEPIPEPAPQPVSYERAPDLVSLSKRYGKARAAMLVSQRLVEELRGKLADAQVTYDKARAEHDEALAALDAVAAEPER